MRAEGPGFGIWDLGVFWFRVSSHAEDWVLVRGVD